MDVSQKKQPLASDMGGNNQQISHAFFILMDEISPDGLLFITAMASVVSLIRIFTA